MKKSALLSCVAVAALLLPGCKHYEYPFQNPRLSFDKRADNLLSLLTPEEKIGLMMNGSISVDRLDIPAYNWWNEACHGICYDDVTVFPQVIALGATFDAPQQFEIYNAVSDEARAVWNTTDHHQLGVNQPNGSIWHNGLSFWCPNVNIFRDPRWGRGQETPGEDPYLNAVMGTQTVKGMQGNDKRYLKLHSCAKHYAVHSGPEPLRHQFDVTVSGRDLWETYLPAFKSLVQEGNVQEVMCAYHRYEGDPCCASNRLLQDILRNKWGFKGLVVTDCGAIGDFFNARQHGTHKDAASASADAVLSGADIECGTSYRALTTAIQEGLITEADIDVSVRRILKSRFELGMFDPAENLPWANLGLEDLSSPAHTALASKAAHEAIVLLKNSNNLLPIKKDMKIAVVGPNADDARVILGNYNGYPSAANTKTILDGIREAAPQAQIIYEKGCDLNVPYITKHYVAEINGGKGLHAEYYNTLDWTGNVVAKVDYDEPLSLNTTSPALAHEDCPWTDGVNMTGFSAKYTGSFTADYTGDMVYSVRGSSRYTFKLNGQTIVENQGQGGGRGGFGGFGGGRGGFGRGAAATTFKVEKGKTYEISIELSQPEARSANFSFDIYSRGPVDFASVISKIAPADVIVMVSGISSDIEGEGHDRSEIELPEVQQQLLAELDATGKPIILVNVSGSAMGLGNVEHQYDALIQAWYGGQACGEAVADVLFGDYNPAGRLPVTFYKSTDQLPDFQDYSMNNRTYRYFKGEPLYAFGYGLSYTTFSYGDAKTAGKPQAMTLTVPVTNTGKIDGDEVIQVYVKALDDAGAPIKSLAGFARVNIAAGQTQTVKVELSKDAFSFYDEATDGLKFRPGNYRILYGGSSLDKDLKSIDIKL
ncbi:MAG: glycoside hydrolase family 3 C-terminal domain-containing protein [Bacteroidaceae bacterium]|nr:glycoside hydrolase family 3 C-terminal domain-containing protein [Bacteroidaceae bacterium]